MTSQTKRRKKPLPQWLQRSQSSLFSALNGVGVLTAEISGFLVYVLLSLAALSLAMLVGLDWAEWMFLCIAIAVLGIAVTVNAIVQHLLGTLRTEAPASNAKVSDMAHAVVLIAALMAIVTAVVVFWP